MLVYVKRKDTTEVSLWVTNQTILDVAFESCWVTNYENEATIQILIELNYKETEIKAIEDYIFKSW